MKDYPTFDRRLTTAEAHLRDVGSRLDLTEAPARKWVHILALTLVEGDQVRDELLSMHRRDNESFEDFYRRAAQLFKERYKPTEVEIASYLSKLHSMEKGFDEELHAFTQRFNRAWDIAYPGRHTLTPRQLEEKKRAYTQALERDVKRLIQIGGGTGGQSWLDFLSRLDVIYESRSEEDVLRTAKEQSDLRGAKAAIIGADHYHDLTHGVSRPLKDYVNNAGKKISAADWAFDPFATPAPLASSLRALNAGVKGEHIEAPGAGGRNRQRNRGGRGGQKRARSPSPPEPAAAAAASSHDGRHDDAYRERQRQNANKRPRDDKGHFKPGVKHEQQSGPASGANATPQGGGPPERHGVDTAGAKVIVRGPCPSCGLNHTWDGCKRNPQARNFVESERGKTGLHFLATLDGYRPGDENGAYKKLPSFIAQRGTGRANSISQQ